MIWEFFHKFIFSSRAGALVRRIAWLSVISIFISISAFLVVLFVMNGMNNSIEKRIVALEPHLSVEVVGAKTSKVLEVNPAYMKLKQMPGVELSIFESQDVVVRTAEGMFRGAIAQGITSDSIIRLQKKVDELNSLKKSRDSFLERWGRDEIPGEGEAAIGTDLARMLRVNEGDFLTLIPPESLLMPVGEAPTYDRVKIKKIFSTNLADVDSQFIFYQRGKALLRLQNTSGRRLGVDVWTSDISQVGNIKAQLLPFDGVQVETWMERNSDLFFALKLEKLMIGVFLLLAGIVSSASIVGVLSLLLYQKSREIQLLRTLGLSSQKILEMFTRIGLYLTLSGVISGVVIGTAIGFYIQKNPLNVLPNVYYDTQIPALVEPIYILIVLVAGTIIGIWGSWAPTKKITREESLNLNALSH